MKLYSIGQVSDMIDIPVKTIRYYESIGLCVPSQTDENSGYRYYSLEDVYRLDLIKCLGKQLGMPLKTIKKYLECSNDPTVLKQYLRELEGEIDEQIEQLLRRRGFLANKLDAIVRRELVRTLEPTMQRLPSRSVFVRKVKTESLERTLLLVRKLATGAGIAYERKLYLLRDSFADGPASFSDREITIGLDAPPQEGGYRQLELAGGLYALIYYHNRTPERFEAFELLRQFLQENALTPYGPLVFHGTLIDATSVSSQDYFIQMQILVQPDPDSGR